MCSEMTETGMLAVGHLTDIHPDGYFVRLRTERTLRERVASLQQPVVLQWGRTGKGYFLWLRSSWGLDGLSLFSYSLDGDTFTPFGDYKLSWGYYRGDRIGIYNYNNVSESGFIDVDYLHYRMEK